MVIVIRFERAGLPRKIDQDGVHRSAPDMKSNGIGTIVGKPIHCRRLTLSTETFSDFHQVTRGNQSVDDPGNGWGREVCETRDFRLGHLTEAPDCIQYNTFVVVAQLDGIAAFSCHTI